MEDGEILGARVKVPFNVHGRAEAILYAGRVVSKARKSAQWTVHFDDGEVLDVPLDCLQFEKNGSGQDGDKSVFDIEPKGKGPRKSVQLKADARAQASKAVSSKEKRHNGDNHNSHRI